MLAIIAGKNYVIVSFEQLSSLTIITDDSEGTSYALTINHSIGPRSIWTLFDCLLNTDICMNWPTDFMVCTPLNDSFEILLVWSHWDYVVTTSKLQAYFEVQKTEVTFEVV